MSGLCKTCKFWSKRNLNNIVGICISDRLMNYDRRDKERDAMILVLAYDCESETIVTTGENFGCVHWKNEARELLE